MKRKLTITLAGIGLVAAIGAGAAYADHAHNGGLFGRGGARFAHFCATDMSYVSGRVADRLTTRLKLSDPQKASLKDLQDAFVKASADAKALCGETPDMGTVVGRLAFAEKRGEAMVTLMKAVQPKLEAFYSSLDDTQRATLNEMGPRGRFMHPGNDRDDGGPDHG